MTAHYHEQKALGICAAGNIGDKPVVGYEQIDCRQAALAYVRFAQPPDPEVGWRRKDIEAALSAGRSPYG
ncbi:hypothetical protein N2599_20780 (plasmid) [Rhizobium sullae]|uniref:Uncharacterized protein n=1 Tax=Rhizobium sullae TaxID=50338 RepID=A0ABY5XTC4_RHISU|nr:hypothetical protein [Rhizobium sullae]UWU17771.1 hypothetical protein N2599_20780 [Rhizobium sullae]